MKNLLIQTARLPLITLGILLWILASSCSSSVEVTVFPDSYSPAAWNSDGSQLLIFGKDPLNHDIVDDLYFVATSDASFKRAESSWDFSMMRGVCDRLSPDGNSLLYDAKHKSNKDDDLIDLYRGDKPDQRHLLLTADVNIHGRCPTWSPDSQQFAMAIRENGHSILRIFDRDGRAQRDLTSESQEINYLAWSPDGQTIAYVLDSRNLYTVSVYDGRITPSLQVAEYTDLEDLTWSPDSNYLAYIVGAPAGQLYVVHKDTQASKAITYEGDPETGYRYFNVLWSPGNDYIAASRIQSLYMRDQPWKAEAVLLRVPQDLP